MPADAPTTKRPPSHVLALRAVGASSLSASEKAVLMSMLRWWNPVSGALWPSISSIADAAALSVRGVQKILRRLESLDVVRRVRPSEGGTRTGWHGRTNRFELHLAALPRDPRPSRARTRSSPVAPARQDALEPVSGPRDSRVVPTHPDAPSAPSAAPQAAPEAAPAASNAPSAARTRNPGAQPTATDNPEPRAGSHPEPERGHPRTATARDPEPGSPETSIQKELSRNEQSGRVPRQDVFVPPAEFLDGCPERPAPVAGADGGVHAPERGANEEREEIERHKLRSVLRIAGVRGVNLDLLAACPTLRASDVVAEVRDIERDPRARCVSAVLVSRLASLAGVVLPTRPRLDERERGAIERIEALRRAAAARGGARGVSGPLG